jgi:hypothetical protein
MTKIDLVVNNDDQVAIVADKSKSDFSQSLAGVFGSPTPRIHTPLNDLPSRGFEIIDFASMLKLILCPGKNLCWSIRTKSNQMENTQRPWFARLFPGSQVNQQ